MTATFKDLKSWLVRRLALFGKMLASAGGDIRVKKDFAIRLWFAATDEEVARQRNK